MSYVELPPPPSLSSLVACFWAITGPSGEHRVLPDGCIDLIVFGDGQVEVVGTMTEAILSPALSAPVAAIRFLPGEAARLVPEAARELTDRDAPLRELWRDRGSVIEHDLLERMRRSAKREAPELLATLSPAFSSILRSRLASHADATDLRMREAVRLLGEGHSVRATAARVNLSERQLSRRFTERVGVAPKLFGRVMRLQRAANALADGGSPIDVATIAQYTDQAHMNRDFRELARVTPAALAREYAARGAGTSSSNT
ncbi:Transcriptional regulator, AraC family [Labilithrix luteola]|uniref:Transcriptional regulator, AraC family n=1 Tax=Labilithrix luteola TaxID=1391654 RepID=A0A0K1PJU1_9BACT|nr:AraC family transcriptional regulator [Labilithrix luteola]AKU93777.1 Transcriptional regulator, AraC family [Labilithrix luteola]